MTDLKAYSVWDACTRWFHWINVLCVFTLMAVGIVILNADALGVTNDGKVSLKTWHTLVGYVFVLNLVWRFIWAFLGNHHARWSAMLPGGKGYGQAVRQYIVAFVAGWPEQYLGHNPLGRLSVFVLFVLLAIQAVTGLVLAGTDLFYPPFGHFISQWVAAPGVQPGELVPYSPALYDTESYASMRAFRGPFITTHEINFFVLAVVMLLHIVAVVVTEIREGGNLVSAMFTGKKVFSRRPEDAPDEPGAEN